MTLAVAARFPWPGLIDDWPDSVRRVLETFPEMRPPSAIVMAADTRWTYKTGVDFDDGAVKVVALGQNALAVYAGDTVVGPRGLGRLTEEMAGSPPAAAKLAHLARECLQSTWRRFSTPMSRLQVCIGSLDRRDQFLLWRLEDDDGFRLHECNGIETIGSGDARVIFWENLREHIRKRIAVPLTERALGNDVEEWGGLIALSLWETCKSGIDPTVSDEFLLAYLTREGVQGRSLHLADTSSEKLTFQQLTLTPSEAQSFQERQTERVRRK